MLFLIYTNMTVTISLLGVSIQMPDLFPWASSDEAVSRWFPAIANQIFLIGSIVLNLILLGLLVPFMSVHLKMAFMNETTIEGGPACERVMHPVSWDGRVSDWILVVCEFACVRALPCVWLHVVRAGALQGRETCCEEANLCGGAIIACD